MKFTDKQMQELQNCKALCEQCSIKTLRGDTPCFDYLVWQLTSERRKKENEKNKKIHS